MVTAERGSFSAAARALGVAQPTIGRQVGALEQELGVTLFERVGKDRMPSIDEPAFAALDDPRLAQYRIDGDTLVIGYAAEGEAKAYPIHIMNRHEIVNDTFGDAHLTVAW